MVQTHGGDLDRAKARFGGTDWLDLSTGINPVPYPVPQLSAHAWGALPTRADLTALSQAACTSYGAAPGNEAVALAGAQGAIQLVPHLVRRGLARVLGPTYSEHARALQAQGWQVEEVTTLAQLEGAALAVVVNPNNPDGQVWPPEALLALADKVGFLVVDESFADPTPDLSILPQMPAEGVLVMRSFGKFYGLAGVRLGFALCGRELALGLRALAGPWAVSGPAIEIGAQALLDRDWQAQTIARLNADAARLDALAAGQGWRLVGGTTLFRTYDCGAAAPVQDRLAQQAIWSRIFDYHLGWLRLGLPAPEGWARLESALA